jgi:hypothetical protein
MVTVNPNLTSSVNIVADNAVYPNAIAITASAVNGGTSPIYQWYNGTTAVGTNSATYTTTTLTLGQSLAIKVVMTSNATPCLTGSPTTSNIIHIAAPIVPSVRLVSAGIGVASTEMDPSALLEVKSDTKGFLPPRMTATERDAIASPVAGLMLYCSNCGANGELEVYNGTTWTNLGGSAAAANVGSATATSIVSDPTNFNIKTNTVVAVDQLDITPSADFSLNTGITRNTTATNSITNAAISRYYKFGATTNAFSGILKINYDETELNGLTESNLKILYHNGTIWNSDVNSSNNATNNFVQSSSLSNVALNEITTGIGCVATNNITTISVCGSYDWNGKTYTASGLYTGTTTNCVTEKLDLTINSNTITTEPTSTTICKASGGAASFTVATTAETATYQWYSQAVTATTWTALTNTANYSGATTATLNITKTTTTLPATGTKYKVVVTNSCGTLTSAIVTLTDFTVLSKAAAITAKSATNGTLSPALTTCQGNSVNLTLAAGSIGNIQWQSSTDGISYSNVGGVIAQTALSATNPAIPYTTDALTQSTWFRVVASNGVCNSINGTPIKITVSSPANAGTINGGDVTVCAPVATGLDANGNALTTAITNSTSLSLGDYTQGATIVWQKSTNYSAAIPTWAAVANLTATTAIGASYSGAGTTALTVGNLAADTWYRVQVTNGACIAFSTPVKITVSKVAKAGLITSAASVCRGGSISFTSAAYTGTAIRWEVSTTSTTTGFEAVNGANELTFTMNTVAYAPLSKFYVRSVVTSGDCTLARSAVKTIIVNPTTVAGTITGARSVCSGGGTTLKLVSNVGTTIQWQYSTDGESYSNVPTTTVGTAPTFATTSTSGITASYIVTNVTQSTWFKARVTSGLCTAEETAPVQVIVGTSVAGTIGVTPGSSNTICSGTATSLTLSGSIGSIVWAKSTNGGVAWTTVTGTTATVASGALINATTAPTVVTFKATVTLAGGACGSVVTEQVYPVTVLPAAKGGVVAVNDTSLLTVCSGGTKALKVTGYLGNIQWQKSTTSATLGFASITDATTSTYTSESITQNTWFRAVAKNGDCAVTALSNAIAITVSTPVTVGAITAAATGLCPTNTGTTLTLSGAVGVISWSKSTDYTAVTPTWTTVTGALATLATGTLTTTTAFRAKLVSGSCLDYTTPIVVTVKPSTTATVSGTASTLCSGLTTSLTVADYGSGTIQWQKATTLTGTYANVTTGTGMTSATYGTPALTATTYFRALVTNSEGCSSGTSRYTVTINPLAAAKTITGSVIANTTPTAICIGASQTLTMATGSVGTIQWQWAAGTSTSSVWNDIPNANTATLAASNYVPVIGTAITATYYRVKMTNTCSTGVNSATIAVFYKNCASPFREIITKEKFNAIAYPNPFTANFDLAISTSSAENVEVKVYDMIGKLINKMEVSPSKVAGLQIGDRYPSGVYNVIVSQGTEVKTLRVIKQ